MLAKKIAEYQSQYCGVVRVFDLFGRRELVTIDSAGNRFSQSGPVIAHIWAPVLKQVLKYYERPAVLILGLGGGTLIDVIQTLKPLCVFDVVEIDVTMLDIAVGYFGFDPSGATVYIDDAARFVTKPGECSYDIVLVDLFCHEHVPKFSYHPTFLAHLARILKDDGRVVFNRLYYGMHRTPTKKVLDKLRRVLYIETVNMLPSRFFASNMLIVCSKDARRAREMQTV